MQKCVLNHINISSEGSENLNPAKHINIKNGQSIKSVSQNDDEDADDCEYNEPSHNNQS